MYQSQQTHKIKIRIETFWVSIEFVVNCDINVTRMPLGRFAQSLRLPALVTHRQLMGLVKMQTR